MVAFFSPIVRDSVLLVLGRDSQGYYRRYLSEPQADGGRCYRETREEGGRIKLCFTGEQRPETGEGGVLVVEYDSDFAAVLELGRLYGYDDQRFQLPLDGVLPDSLGLMLKLSDAGGEDYYLPLPGDEAIPAPQLSADGGAITFSTNALGQANSLLVCRCAVSRGVGGNLRANALERRCIGPGVLVLGSTATWGGAAPETLDDLRGRMMEQLYDSATAVTCGDYERLAATTPGLRIAMTKAVRSGENRVTIAVKPDVPEKLPRLSSTYRAALLRRFADRRMVTTAVEIAAPAYQQIDVYLSVLARPYHANARQAILALLESELNHDQSGMGFGETISYGALYFKLEQLDCVGRVESLSLHIDTEQDATMQGNDVRLNYNALCCLRSVELQLGNYLTNG